MALSELDDFIADLERIQRTLSDATAFFAGHEAGYLELARRVGTQTLLALRPEHEDAAKWLEDVGFFSSAILARGLPQGLEIVYLGRTGGDDSRSRDRPAGAPITYEDVLEWVKAGAENGGKDWTAVENTRDRNPEQIAYDVITAINQHHLGTEKKDYGRITDRMEAWVNSRALGGDLGQLLEAVLEAWYTALCPVVARDFEKWVDETVNA